MLVGFKKLSRKTCKFYVCGECLRIHYADGLLTFESSIDSYSLPHNKVTALKWVTDQRELAIVNMLNTEQGGES